MSNGNPVENLAPEIAAQADWEARETKEQQETPDNRHIAVAEGLMKEIATLKIIKEDLPKPKSRILKQVVGMCKQAMKIQQLEASMDEDGADDPGVIREMKIELGKKFDPREMEKRGEQYPIKEKREDEKKVEIDAFKNLILAHAKNKSAIRLKENLPESEDQDLDIAGENIKLLEYVDGKIKNQMISALPELVAGICISHIAYNSDVSVLADVFLLGGTMTALGSLVWTGLDHLSLRYNAQKLSQEALNKFKK